MIYIISILIGVIVVMNLKMNKMYTEASREEYRAMERKINEEEKQNEVI